MNGNGGSFLDRLGRLAEKGVSTWIDYEIGNDARIDERPQQTVPPGGGRPITDGQTNVAIAGVPLGALLLFAGAAWWIWKS